MMDRVERQGPFSCCPAPAFCHVGESLLSDAASHAGEGGGYETEGDNGTRDYESEDDGVESPLLQKPSSHHGL